MSEAQTLTPDVIVDRVTQAGGDLAKLSHDERKFYVRHKADAYGLNHLLEPFALLMLDNKLTLYVTRAGTDQIRRKESISVRIVAREEHDGMYIVTCQASTPDGRTDEAVGAVPLVQPNGEWKTDARTGRRYFVPDPLGTVRPLDPKDRANAIMKCETKAKRRATISIAGMGMLDESELDGFDEIEMDPRPRVRSTRETIRRPLTAVEPEAAAEDPPPDRAALMATANRCRTLLKLDARTYADLWREHCGQAGPDNVDPAALTDFVGVLQARLAERGLLL